MGSKERLKQLAFFGALMAVVLVLLREAFRLDFVVRGTLGPGFYPAVVLVVLAIATLAALVDLLRRREIVVLSPFPEGLRGDAMLRRLAAGAASRLGVDVRVTTRDGAGVFSALWAGSRATGPATLAAVSSETPDLTPAETADWTRARLVPLARLQFDPDVLAAAPGRALDDLARSGGPIRLGCTGDATATAAVRSWLGGRDARAIETEFAVPAELLVAGIAAGRFDAAVMPVSAVREPLARGELTALAAFRAADDAVDGIGPAAAEVGPSLVSGAWAGLAVARRQADHVDPTAVHDAFAGALRDIRREEPEAVADGVWAVEPAARFAGFLDAMAAGSGGRHADLPTGRLIGLLAAIIATLGFFWAMEVAGFPLAAFVFLTGLILLLEPRLDVRTALRAVIVGGGVAFGLHQLFWRVFYVVFPDGILFGG